MPSDFENSIKEFMSLQKNFNALLQEKLLKVDDLARNVDRISLEIDSINVSSQIINFKQFLFKQNIKILL